MFIVKANAKFIYIVIRALFKNIILYLIEVKFNYQCSNKTCINC